MQRALLTANQTSGSPCNSPIAPRIEKPSKVATDEIRTLNHQIRNHCSEPLR
jgi:hypothetical protein